MKSLQDFIHMGGYGFYVWISYGITAVVLLLNIWLPLRQCGQFFRRQFLKSKRPNP